MLLCLKKTIIKNYCKKNQILHLFFNSQNSRHRSHKIVFSSCIRWIFYGWNLFCFNILYTDFWSVEYSSAVLRMEICGFSIKDCKTFNDFSKFVAAFEQFLTLSVSSKRLFYEPRFRDAYIFIPERCIKKLSNIIVWL